LVSIHTGGTLGAANEVVAGWKKTWGQIMKSNNEIARSDGIFKFSCKKYEMGIFDKASGVHEEIH
jgi:hypothetical protein